MDQQGLARERLGASPAGRIEVARRIAQRGHVEARLVERPSQVEFAERQVQERQCELRRRVTWLHVQRPTETLGCLAMTPEGLQDDPQVGVGVGGAFANRGVDERLQGFGQPPQRRQRDTPVGQHL